MSNKALPQDTHKDCGINNAENILNRFADRCRICKEYGQDHKITPSFDDVRTGIDKIPELFVRSNMRESRDSFN